MKTSFDMSDKKLIISIIGQAIEDMFTDVSRIRDKHQRINAIRYRDHAIKWFESNSKKEKSFEWYCQMIDINPNWIRNKIKLMGERNAKENLSSNASVQRHKTCEDGG